MAPPENSIWPVLMQRPSDTTLSELTLSGLASIDDGPLTFTAPDSANLAAETS